MRIEKYDSTEKNNWDEFVKKCKNTHFFFQRDYMDYHADRFVDYSLMVYDDKDKIIALLPANVKDNIVYSHGGLTFGGFLVDDKMTAEKMLELFTITKQFLHKNNMIKMIYKCIPHIYHTHAAEEDRYALFVNNARLIRRDISATVYIVNPIAYQERRKRSIKKAIKSNLLIEKSENYEEFWEVLVKVLNENHQANPVHCVSEIKKLAIHFKDNIKLFVAKKDDVIIAGTVIFENDNIAHTQYLANSEEGRAVGALDLVIHHLITEVYKDKQYFDFGISNEEQGRVLNTGLIAQKEGFGARGIVHDFYEIDV